MAGFGGAIRSCARDDLIRSVEREAIYQQIAARYLGSDYFSRNENIRLESLSTAAALGGMLSRESLDLGECILKEDIRRVNCVTQIANSTVSPMMLNQEVQPKLSISDGRYPRDFDRPKRVEEFLSMDSNSLDRILIVYNLPRDSGFRHHTSLLLRNFSGIGVEAARENKLYTLFEYLGLDLCEQRIGGMRGLGGGAGLGGSLRGGGRLSG